MLGIFDLIPKYYIKCYVVVHMHFTELAHFLLFLWIHMHTPDVRKDFIRIVPMTEYHNSFYYSFYILIFRFKSALLQHRDHIYIYLKIGL